MGQLRPFLWPHGEHVLQLYPEGAQGAGIGNGFAADGLRRDEAVLVIASTTRSQVTLRQLESANIDAQAAVASGQLRVFGAQTVLSSARPAETLGAMLRFARSPRHAGLRVVSELTGLLWRTGDHEGALAVERCWNALAGTEAFSLMCVCGLNALDSKAYEGALQSLGALHTHLVPVDNCDAFDDAVGRAVADVLEPRLVRMVHALSAAHRPAIHMPTGVALLFWLKQHMPRTAEKVLARSRVRWTEH